MLGLNIEDAHLATLTRRVLAVSSLCALVTLGLHVFGSFHGSEFSSEHEEWNTAEVRFAGFVSAALGIIVALAVPACGYFGARMNSPCLTCCFCGWSLVGGCSSFFLAAFLVFAMVIIKGQATRCHENTPAAEDPHGFRNCVAMLELEDTVEGAGTFVVAILLVTTLLQCFGHWWGNQLFVALRKGFLVHQVVGRPVLAKHLPQPSNGQAVYGLPSDRDVERSSLAEGAALPGLAQV